MKWSAPLYRAGPLPARLCRHGQCERRSWWSISRSRKGNLFAVQSKLISFGPVTAESSHFCVITAATFASIAQPLPLPSVNNTVLLIPDVWWSREYHSSSMLTLPCPHPLCRYIGKTKHGLDTRLFLKNSRTLARMPLMKRGAHFSHSDKVNVVERR